MSSGTQVDLDWAGMDAGASGAGVSSSGVANGVAPGGGRVGTAGLSDEEILGISSSVAGGLANDSDSELDGLATVGARHAVPLQPEAANQASNASGLNPAAGGAMPAWLHALVGDPKHGAEAQQLWQEHQAFRAAFSSADEARAMRELLPGGAQEVQALREIAQEVDSLRLVAREAESLRQNAEAVREASQSVERIDAAIFSGDARAQSEVVAEIARANPAAFRSLFAEAAKVLAGMGAGGREPGNGAASSAGRAEVGGVSDNRPTPREDDEGWATRNSNQRQNLNQNPNEVQDRYVSGSDRFGPGRGIQESPYSRAQDGPIRANESRFARNQAEQAVDRAPQSVGARQSPFAEAQGKPNFDAAAYASFERSTNDVVARDVRGSISDTLARVLPDGVADGAAKRIGEDIFNEVHRALAADRTLSEQVGEVLRDRRFGSAEQQRVAALLAGRAKQLVPSMARRVIGEWTSSVLGTARTKAARQAAAASRVDIAAPGGSLDSTPLRAMSAREIDYASMSDDEILGM